MFKALLGAGASLLGGIFGGDDEPKETVNRVDYVRMVKDAEAAGFNPLTALRNGGAAGFSVSTTSGTPLSTRIANGVSNGVQSFLTNFNPFQDQQREAEFNLVQAQLANLNADTLLKQRTGLGSVPSYTAGSFERDVSQGIKRNQSFKSVTDVLPVSAGVSQTPTVERPTVTNPFPTSWGIEVNPNVPDASAWEERFGDSEIFSTLYGLGIGLSDMGYNARRGYNAIVEDYKNNDAYMRKNAKPPKGFSTMSDVLGDMWNGRFKSSPSPLSPRSKKQ